MMVLLELFLSFVKIGLFAIGGGMATLPFLQELSETKGWYSVEMLADMIAVSESTPGPIGINMATFAGFHAGGVLGGITATLSLVLPSVVICILVAKVLDKFNENKYVKSVFDILRPVVVGLISAAGYQIFKISMLHTDLFQETGKLSVLLDWKAVILFVVLFVLVLKWKKHPIVFVAIGAAVGIVLKM